MEIPVPNPQSPPRPLARPSLPPLPPPLPAVPPAVPSVVEGPPPLPPTPAGFGEPGGLDRARAILRPLAILGFVAFLIIAGVYFFGPNLSNLLAPQTRAVTLSYWGLWEDPAVVTPLLADFIKDYEAQNPRIDLTINYEKKTFGTLDQYKETLLTRLRQGTGPDVFRLHASWVSSLKDELAALPSKVLSETDYQLRFYPAALTSAKIRTDLFALPLEYDGLVLFYNQKLFEGVNVAEELKTWEGFRRQAVRLTQWEGNDRAKKITRAGVAFGAANNISHSADLLSLLLSQSAVDPLTGLSSPAAADALTFYTNFSKVDRVWDETLPFSINAFANEQAAMVFGPSWRALDIKNLNPQLDFAAVLVPQLPAAPQGGVHWATFWMEGVSKDSRETEIAWRLLEFLSKEEQQRNFYSNAAKGRSFGEPYALRSLAKVLAEDKLLGPLLSSASNAKTGKTVDFSGNAPYVNAFKQAIGDVLGGKSATEALKTAQATIDQLEGKAPSP